MRYGDEKIPRVLICGHTFCQQCIENLILNNNIRCPTCRRYTSLNAFHQNEVLHFNFLVPNLSLMDALLIRTQINIPDISKLILTNHLIQNSIMQNRVERIIEFPVLRINLCKIKFLLYFTNTIMILYSLGYVALTACFIIGRQIDEDFVKKYTILWICIFLGYVAMSGSVWFFIIKDFLRNLSNKLIKCQVISNFLLFCYLLGINIWAAITIFKGIIEMHAFLYYVLIASISHQAALFIMIIPYWVHRKMTQKLLSYRRRLEMNPDIIF